jgi:hypothetical protein
MYFGHLDYHLLLGAFTQWSIGILILIVAIGLQQSQRHYGHVDPVDFSPTPKEHVQHVTFLQMLWNDAVSAGKRLIPQFLI